jgi:hypothetical protein
MTTKLVVIEKLLDRAICYATENKWPDYAQIPEFRKKIQTPLLAAEVEARCGPAYDNGHLADYVDIEFQRVKAGAVLNGSAKPGSAIATWNPTPADKAFAVDILTKIIKVLRA